MRIFCYDSTDDLADLNKAIKLINDYYAYEFDQEDGDGLTIEDDLSNVGLMNTTAEDDNGDSVDLQAIVDLINCTLDYYVGFELVRHDQYSDLTELIDKVLTHLNFEDLAATCEDYMDQ